MRAKTINEFQNFERGQDPFDAMKIGESYKWEEYIEELRDALLAVKIETVFKPKYDHDDTYDILLIDEVNYNPEIDDLQLGYNTKEAEKKYGFAEGFELADQDGNEIKSGVKAKNWKVIYNTILKIRKRRRK